MAVSGAARHGDLLWWDAGIAESVDNSGEFLKAMASCIADLTVTARAWCIFDNTAAGFATSNAIELNEELEKANIRNALDRLWFGQRFGSIESRYTQVPL